MVLPVHSQPHLLNSSGSSPLRRVRRTVTTAADRGIRPQLDFVVSFPAPINNNNAAASFQNHPPNNCSPRTPQRRRHQVRPQTVARAVARRPRRVARDAGARGLAHAREPATSVRAVAAARQGRVMRRRRGFVVRSGVEARDRRLRRFRTGSAERGGLRVQEFAPRVPDPGLPKIELVSARVGFDDRRVEAPGPAAGHWRRGVEAPKARPRRRCGVDAPKA